MSLYELWFCIIANVCLTHPYHHNSPIPNSMNLLKRADNALFIFTSATEKLSMPVLAHSEKVDESGCKLMHDADATVRLRGNKE